VSALDRIQRVKLIDVKDGDLLLLEVDPAVAAGWANGDAPDEGPNMLDTLGEVVRAELDRIGRANVGVLIATRGTFEATIVRADET
jgi:hypothetical protein